MVCLETTYLLVEVRNDFDWSMYAVRHDVFIAYMARDWMSDLWRWLWISAGRERVSHFTIRTSNHAEQEHRQVKGSRGPVMDGRAVSDPVVVIRAEIGLPSDPESIHTSYVMARAVRIAHIMSNNTNMRLPDRQFITPLRKHLDEIRATPHGVLDVDSAEGVIYDVAGAARRSQLTLDTTGLAAPSPDAGGLRYGYYRVNIFHGDNCKDYFCKHLLAARIAHLEAGRPRCWRDAELAPYYSDVTRGGEGLSVSDLFSSSMDDAERIPACADDLNAQYDSQTGLLSAKFSALGMAMDDLSEKNATLGPVADDAVLDDLRARATRSRDLAQLTTTLANAEKKARYLAGDSRVSAAGMRRPDPCARSVQEVQSQRVSSLQFTGEVHSATAARSITQVPTTQLSIADVAGALIDSVQPVKRRRDVSRTGVALSSDTSVADLTRQCEEIEKHLRSKLREKRDRIRALEFEVKQLRHDLDNVHDDVDLREAAAEDAGHTAGAALAYRDAVQRTRDVATRVYADAASKPIRDALLTLASGIERAGKA